MISTSDQAKAGLLPDEQDSSGASGDLSGASRISIRDFVRLATQQLRGSSQQLDRGFRIDIRNTTTNYHLALAFTRSSDLGGAINLRIDSVALRDGKPLYSFSQVALANLLVSWETPGLVTFTYSGGGRYTAINVSYDVGVFVNGGQDNRADEPKDAMSELEKRAKHGRRAFYQLGQLFDTPSGTDMAGDLSGHAPSWRK